MVFVLMAERADTGVAKHFLPLTQIFTLLLTEPAAKFNSRHEKKKKIQTEDGISGALFLIKLFVVEESGCWIEMQNKCKTESRLTNPPPHS